MGDSLENKVKQFADAARQKLQEEIAREKNKDTKKAKWVGFNSDGKSRVKFDNKEESVKGLGNVSPVQGSAFVMDKAGSIEQGQRKTREEAPKVKAAKSLDIKKEVKKYELLPPIEVILGAERDNYLLIYRNAWNAYKHIRATALSWDGYSNNYGKQESDTRQNVLRASTNVNSTSFSVGTVHILNGATGYITTASASVAWGGVINISESDVSSGTGPATESFSHDIKSSIGNGNGSGTVSIQATQYAAAVAFAETHSYGLDISTTYYYTLGGETEIERSIDLQTIVGSDILYIWNIHNYLAIENEEHILYSVFVVRQVLSDSFSEDVQQNTGTFYDSMGLAIPLTAKIAHTRLNLNTGALNSNVTGGSIIPGLGMNWAEYHHFGYSLPGFEMGALHYFSITQGGNSSHTGNIITPSPWDIENAQPSQIFDILDPTPIFTNAFPGDWISNIPFQAWSGSPNAVAPALNWNILSEFLMLDYDPDTQKLNSYDSRMAAGYPYVPPCNEITWPSTKRSQNAVNFSSIQNITDVATALGDMITVGDLNLELDVSNWFQYVAGRGINEKGYAYPYMIANMAPNLTMNLPMASLGVDCNLVFTDPDANTSVLGELRYIRVPQ